MHGREPSAPRCAALIGPYLSGKTSLLESILSITGTITRKGKAGGGHTVGDWSAEARDRGMSVETTVASTTFLNEHWTFLDCPGSVELLPEALNAVMVADVAVVVVEPDVDHAVALSPLLRFLDDMQIPHLIFINKIDQLAHRELRVRDVVAALQGVSTKRLVLRQVPIRNGEGEPEGYVDLVSERAYKYQPGEASSRIDLPDSVTDREQEARQELLEALADYDDGLLEQLLEDVTPETTSIYEQLTKDLGEDLIVPVLLGSAEQDSGVRRLLKALRHEAPEPAITAERLGVVEADPASVLVFKTQHAAHAGKQALARVFHGTLPDGMTVGDERIGGIQEMVGAQSTARKTAVAGAVVALGRLDSVSAGDLLGPAGACRLELWPDAIPPVHAVAITAADRKDEVKLTQALQKLVDDDPALTIDHVAETSELVLSGQGDIHIAIAVDRLKSKFNVSVESKAPTTPYRETIRQGTKQHSRFKRQTGGHGQFADVKIEIAPRGRGEGYQFNDKIVGGAIPRTYIPAVDAGVQEAMQRGPLGFMVVDFEITLVDGQFHAVDSSELAFKTAGRQALNEALPACNPVLLEPIMQVTISVPNPFTARVQRVITGRRGQILGFDAKPGWDGWDELVCHMPQAEMQGLIVDLRSSTQGVGTYAFTFDHLAELSGRLADQVVERRRELMAAQ